jgi:hypothetical protein
VRKPRTLFITGRTESKTSSAVKEMRKIDKCIKTIFVPLDLTTLESLSKTAEAVLESEEDRKINDVADSAKIMVTMPFWRTDEEVELKLGVVSALLCFIMLKSSESGMR